PGAAAHALARRLRAPCDRLARRVAAALRRGLEIGPGQLSSVGGIDAPIALESSQRSPARRCVSEPAEPRLPHPAPLRQYESERAARVGDLVPVRRTAAPLRGGGGP